MMEHKDTTAIDREVRAEIFELIPQLTHHNLSVLRACLRVMEVNRGNAPTPVEDFILELIRYWEQSWKEGRGLKPDQIIELIEAPCDGCRSWFDDAVAIARDFSARYPDLVAGGAQGIRQR